MFSVAVLVWPSYLLATPRESVMLDCGFSTLISSLIYRNMRLGDVLLPPGIKQWCLYPWVQGLLTWCKVFLMQLSVSLSGIHILSGLVPKPLARYKSNWSTPFRYFELSCNGWAWARKLTHKQWNRKKVEEEDKKVWKAHINEDNHRREKANDRYDVRSRDCHATDAHVT